MKYSDYKDVIDFRPLKGILAGRGITQEYFAEQLGIKPPVLSNYISGRALPTTKQLASMCALLQCSADSLVKFTGYEVKECYKIIWDGYGKPRWNDLSYEPLRRLFMKVYGEKWKDKLREFYDTIPRPELSEAQLKNKENRTKGVLEYQQKRKEKGEYKGISAGHKDKWGVGLSVNYRSAIAVDKPIPLPRLYDICKALHCTPDWVMTYN